MENQNLLNELNDEIEASQSLPYCWVVNPPNMKVAEIKKLDPPFGVFLPADQAEAAQLNAPEWAIPSDISFGEEENVKSGFLFKRLRFLVIARSPLIIQEMNENGNWAFSGQAYHKGNITDLGAREKESSSLRMRSFYLIMLVDESNRLLHQIPIKLTLGKGPGAGITNEVNTFRKEVERTFFKLQGMPEQRLSQRAHAMTVLDLNLGFHKSGTNAPFCCPVSRKAPAIDDVGKTTTVSRRDRAVELTGIDIRDVLISKSSETGNVIINLFEEYKDYFDFPLIADKEKTESEQPAPEFGNDIDESDLSNIPF